MTTIAHILPQVQTRGLSRLEAQRVLLHALGRADTERAWLLSHDTDALPVDALARLETLVQRFTGGEPLAYLLGHQAFYGLDLLVDHRALVPRPDTEPLVDWALEVVQDQPLPRVIDLGTGSGAIALALKATRPQLEVWALDFSADALTLARSNAQRLDLEIQFLQGAWMDGLAGPFDLIVSNPPYIAEHDPHLAALTHEPLAALASGLDGLTDIRCLINQAASRLTPGGWLLLEHGYDQANAVRTLLQAAGFAGVQSRLDLAGIERCSGGQWPNL